MRMDQRQTLAICVIAIAIGNVAVGQNQREEYFNFSNPTGEPVDVYLRAKGRGTIDRNWQERINVKARGEGSIRLKGFEPFDIAIRKKDGTYIVAYDAYLCDMMKQCKRTGQTDFSTKAIKGRWVKTNGKDQFVKFTDSEIELPIEADENQVTLTLSPLIGKSDPRPIPERPKKNPPKPRS